MPPQQPLLLGLSDANLEKIESLLEQFDRSWTMTRLAQAAKDWPVELRALRFVALVEMIKIDLDRSWQTGERRALEFYLQKYPELGTSETIPGELIETEIDIVRQHEGHVAAVDYQHRFPGRDDEISGWCSAQNSTLNSSDAVARDTARFGQAPRNTACVVGAGVASVSLPEHFGRYRVLKVIGEGGMGAAFLAHDSELDRDVVLKVPRVGADVEVLKRFQQEARAAARLHHPNVCPIHDVGEIDGIHYISLAFVRGRELTAFIRKDNPLPPHKAAMVARMLAKTLHYAHEQGIVHRDLKPANVMIDEHKQPIVMDFGLACILDQAQNNRMTATGVIMGTPAYMAPEQAQSQLDKIGTPADIFSLGVIFYEMLTSELPFQADSSLGVLMKLIKDEPVPPSTIRPSIPPQLEAICLKMMAKRIEDRYATAQEVANAIGSFLKSERKTATHGVRTTDMIEQDELQALHGLPVSGEQPQSDIRQSVAPVKSGYRTLQLVILTTAIVIMLGIVFLVKTPKGTIRVEVEDTSLKVVLDGNNLSVGDFNKPLTIKAGPHTIRVESRGKTVMPGQTMSVKADNADKKLLVRLGNLELDGEEFEVRQGDDLALKISLIDLPETQTTTSPEKTASALHFTGNDWIELHDLKYSSMQPWTLEVIVSAQHTTSETTQSILSNTDDSGQGIALEGGCWTFHYRTHTMSRIRSQKYAIPNKPTHIAGVYDGYSISFYVNGQLQQVATGVTRHIVSRSNFFVGADPDETGKPQHFFRGDIYGARISNTARYRGNFSPPRSLVADQQSVAVYDADSGVVQGKLRNLAHDRFHGTVHGVNLRKAPAWSPEKPSATVDGHVSPPPPPPPLATAFAFNDGNDWIGLRGFNYTQSAPWTMEAIVRPEKLKSQRIISNEEDTGITLGMAGNQWCFTCTTNEGRKLAFSPRPAVPGEVVHVAGVYDGQSIHLYLNGKLQQSVAVNRIATSPPRDFIMGAEPDQRGAYNPECFWVGLIYSVRVSNGARYCAAFPPPATLEADKDTIALYSAESGIVGRTVRNLAQDKFHGTNYGVSLRRGPQWQPPPATVQK